MTNTRSQQIGIRLSAAERRTVEAAAESDRRNVSDWVRLVILRAAAKRPRRRKAA